jgi:hypothetical protein
MKPTLRYLQERWEEPPEEWEEPPEDFEPDQSKDLDDQEESE